jgi:superfamily II DNA/RNA helicase
LQPATDAETTLETRRTLSKGSPLSFADLGLPRPLVSSLARQGIDSPFPIQAATIPDALAGRDLLGRGQTGSGKTLAFGLPTLARVAGTAAAPKRPRALVLVPTRELAQQVRDVLEPLGRGLCVRVRAVVGGTSFAKQVDNLRRGVEVLVATPGRLTDLIEQGACSLADVSVVVLDEADQMADMGFLPAVRALLDQVPAGGQRMLFSATLDGEVDTLVRRYLADPVRHSLTPPSASVEAMEHHALVVRREEKVAVTAAIANRDGRTILFARTRHGVDRLTKQLASLGVRAGALHGGLAQGVRTRTLAEFREGAFGALVATDVAARGIHVDDVSLVVHVDPPADPKHYLHRAGRTARAGSAGTVVTLVTSNEVRAFDTLTRRAGVRPQRTPVTLGSGALADLTGARTPAGDPLPVHVPAPPARPQHARGPRSATYRDRTGRPDHRRTSGGQTARPRRQRRAA